MSKQKIFTAIHPTVHRTHSHFKVARNEIEMGKSREWLRVDYLSNEASASGVSKKAFLIRNASFMHPAENK